MPTLRSRRHPAKVMFIGIVAPPSPDHNFHGKILIKRVSQKKKLGKNTFSKYFHDNYTVNNNLKLGKWRLLHILSDNDIENLILLIQQECDLDDDIASCIVFSYHTYTESRKTRQVKRLNSKDGKLLEN